MNHGTGRLARSSLLISLFLFAVSAPIFGGACLAAQTNAAPVQQQANPSQQNSSPTSPAANGQQSSAPSPSPSPSTSSSSSSAPAQQATAPAPQATAPGQETTPPAQDAKPAPEVNTQESPIPFRVRVNLVPVRVVVHDGKGQPVKDLKREDFKIFQDGKPQTLSTFSVETPNARLAAADANAATSSAPPIDSATDTPRNIQLPTRFVALLFDDINVQTADLMRVRQSALKFLDSSIRPTDRVAVLTFSGQSQQDFTDDRAKLNDAIARLMPSMLIGNGNTSMDCPPMDYYEADQIENKNDQLALAVATQDAIACLNPVGTQASVQNEAAAMVQSMAQQKLSLGYMQTQYAFRGLQGALRRIIAMPGQRVIVLVSPGFIYPTQEDLMWATVDQATRSNVFINTLDARGLYTPAMFDASQTSHGSPLVAGQHSQMQMAAEFEESEVLASLAGATGGFAFRNSNDLDAGFRTLASAPDVSYLLGYTPEGLKMDGRFHSIKVTLATKGYTVQARKGFVAPKHDETPEEAAKREIEDALFSQEIESGVPIALHTQYFKPDPGNAKLSIQTHVDVAHIRFQKAADGRNRDQLTVVAGLFDQNGNYLNGYQKVVELKLRDATLERLTRTGMTVTTDFDVKPGAYVVRLVVRDAEADALSTQNGLVEIPY
jgi:VWFA-related protein